MDSYAEIKTLIATIERGSELDGGVADAVADCAPYAAARGVHPHPAPGKPVRIRR